MNKFLTGAILALFLISCGRQVYPLAYASNRDKNLDIFLSDSDTTQFINLTNSPETEYNFTFTGDGKTLYYTLYKTKERQINRIDLVSLSIDTVIRTQGIQSLNDVSDDGRYLLVSSSHEEEKGEIYTYEVATGIMKRITNNQFSEAGAKFSPDGRFVIAGIQVPKPHDTVKYAGAEIFQIELLNQNTKQLTSLGGFNALPDYSPDGKLVSFHSCNQGVCDIYLIKPDGTDLTNLTGGQGDNRWPRWSPDGKWIAYTRTVGKSVDIYFMNRKGKKQKPVIATAFRDEVAEFSPVLN